MALADVLSVPVMPACETPNTTRHLPNLRSNQGDYVDQSSTGWMRSTPPDTSLDKMRKRFKEDGYIWVKNVLPREDVYDMREQ